LNVSFPGVSGDDLLARTPELCAAAGATFHSGDTSQSATLAAMGVPADVARGAVRLSLGWQSTDDEIERAANLLIHAWETLRGI
jgi:cysteine desulfurase